MSKERAIASHVMLAISGLQSVKKLGLEDRNSANLLFYVAENLILAVLTSEDVDVRRVRSTVGNHQLDRMIDCLPDQCSVKTDLGNLAPLTAFATTYRYPEPSGGIPEAPKTPLVENWYNDLFKVAELFARHFRVPGKDSRPLAGYVGPFRRLDG